MADYVTAAPAFVRGKFRTREASRFCDFFLLIDLLRFHIIFSILTQPNLFCKRLDVLNNEY